MSERINKTSICSVVFLDIIDYSKKSVSEQIDDKDHFNALINEAIKDVAQNDRIILDTGDGAAIALLGAPEEALFVSLTIRDGILKQNKEGPQGLFVRIGINLGPVRVVSDINGQPNIIGDGINVAQRVMSFAEPNQILVSRSYYEVTSRLTKEITQMFSYSGVKHDKHVREHEVYAIRSTADEPIATSPAESSVSAVTEEPAKESSGLLWYVLAGVTLAVIAGVFLILGEMHKPGPKPSAPQAELSSPLASPSVAPAPVVAPDKSGQQTPATPDSAPKKKTAKRSKPKSDDTASQATQNSTETKPAATQTSASQTGTDRHHPSNATAETAGAQHKEKSEQKSGWDAFKESVKQGAEKKVCTQAEIAMGQCH